MNKTFWQNETNPLVLLAILHPMCTHGSMHPQTRQSRMYLLACARRRWHRLPRICHALVSLAEVYADAPHEEEWLRAQAAPIAEQLMHSDGEQDDLFTAEISLATADHISVDRREALRGTSEALLNPPLTADEWRGLAALVYLPFERNTPAFTWVPRQLHSLRLLHEVYGNPYRGIHFDANWRTDTAMSLARSMYDRREYSAMPILADALQDAGCYDEDILSHCRDRKQIHTRGCWVLDLVLGKS